MASQSKIASGLSRLQSAPARDHGYRITALSISFSQLWHNQAPIKKTGWIRSRVPPVTAVRDSDRLCDLHKTVIGQCRTFGGVVA